MKYYRRFAVRVEDGMYKDITALCESRGISISVLIRELFDEVIKQDGYEEI